MHGFHKCFFGHTWTHIGESSLTRALGFYQPNRGMQPLLRMFGCFLSTCDFPLMKVALSAV